MGFRSTPEPRLLTLPAAGRDPHVPDSRLVRPPTRTPGPGAATIATSLLLRRNPQPGPEAVEDVTKEAAAEAPEKP